MPERITTPFARPLYVMVKPVGSSCNLACSYCYYMGKGSGVMSDELLELFTQQYIEAQTLPQVLFTWHGGEPLLRPLSFYRRALQLQQRYAGERHIDNCLQTNGTLLTDEWCRFLRDNHFLVGISIDGPQHLHDALRRSPGGRPSWADVMRGIELLQKHGVEWNAMATVNAVNVNEPQQFYHFFRSIGCQYLQFTPVVPAHKAPKAPPTAPEGASIVSRAESIVSPSGDEGGALGASGAITPQQWGHFLCTVYDEWVQRDVGQLFVQLFDATLACWAGEPPGLCALSPQCTGGAVIDTDGTVYSCDHFVFPRYRLGNIREQTLMQMLYGEQQQRFVNQKTAALPRQCRECQYLFACHGECPRGRFATDAYGEPGLNYLCQGYRQYFSHVAPDMNFMLRELQAGRPPSNIMYAKAKNR